MRKRLGCFLCALVVAANTSVSAQPDADDLIRFTRDDDRLFLHAADLATALDYELKVVQAGKLITFCRDRDEGFCIPMRLTEKMYRGRGNELMLAADVVGTALRFQAAEVGGKITVKQLAGTPADAKTETRGYNADWGPGRGFRKGDTLPDIPLVDMNGDEVRFSAYLGKRYILYCWASW